MAVPAGFGARTTCLSAPTSSAVTEDARAPHGYVNIASAPAPDHLWPERCDWTADQALRLLVNTTGLEEEKGDPGDPEICPLTNKRMGNPASRSKPPASPESAKSGAADKVKVADSAPREGGNTRARVAACAVVAPMALGGGAFAVARACRR